jgi:hypothetical protein
MATTWAPTDATRSRTAAKAAGSVRSVGVSTHVAPSNIPASAPSIPSVTSPSGTRRPPVPAMG